MGKETKRHCNQCSNHCPADALKCKRGKKYFEKLEAKEVRMQEKEWSEQEMKPEREEGRGREGRRGREEGRGREGRRGREESRGREGRRGHHGGEEYHTEDIPGLLRACGRHLHRHSCKEKGGGQGRILAILAKRESMTQKELQELLEVKSGSLSELIGKLENKRLINRVKDVEDKRKSVIRITEEGRSRVEARISGEKARDMLRVLSEEEQEQLRTLLQKLLQGWREEE